MLFQRNILESIIVVSCVGVGACVFVHLVSEVSPLGSVWLAAWTLAALAGAATGCVCAVQAALALSRPLVPRAPAPRPRASHPPYDTRQLSVISAELERQLVSAWYVPHVSQEIGFPFACKQLLDQMIEKAFQICENIDLEELFVDVCTVLASHLQEYQKALKRQEKSPNTPLEELYMKGCGGGAEDCADVVRALLKELLPWELWDTPHSELLVRILTMKLNSIIDTTITDPAWLNDKILTIVEGPDNAPPDADPEQEPDKEKDSKIKEKTIEISTPTEIPLLVSREMPAPISFVHDMESLPLAALVVAAEASEAGEGPVGCAGSQPVDIQGPVLRARRGRQGRNEVKIYDRIIEGSVQTWKTDVDLQCVSLGQDILAGHDILSASPPDLEQSGSELEPAPSGSEPEPPAVLGPAPGPVQAAPALWPPRRLWLGAGEEEGEGEGLLRELSETVNVARSRIGGLQVTPAHAPHAPHRHDEAAGVVEGLLGLGRAGLRRGLRLTGLGDESPPSAPGAPARARPTSAALEAREGPPPAMAPAPVTTLLQREDPPVVLPGSPPPLSRQRRVASPSPQYEEPADLSASIAKLRCLLQERAHTQRGEEWWSSESNSEPLTEPAAVADEFELSAERASPEHSNNMQRLDKLFHRTVTGVFNSLRGAVGGEEEPPRAPPPPPHPPRHTLPWTYVPTSVELSVCGGVARLVGARRAAAHVDAALDPLTRHAAPPRGPAPAHDYEEWCEVLGRGWSGAAALGAAAGLVRAHVAARLVGAVAADVVQGWICSALTTVADWLRTAVFGAFERLAGGQREGGQREGGQREGRQRRREVDLEHTCEALLQRVPKMVVAVCGSNRLLSAIRVCVRSMGGAGGAAAARRVLRVAARHARAAATHHTPNQD